MFPSAKPLIACLHLMPVSKTGQGLETSLYSGLLEDFPDHRVCQMLSRMQGASGQLVGGAPTSAHMWFSSLDIRPGVYTNTNRINLGLEGARVYVDQGDELGIGFGAYGRTPSNIHLDTHRNSKHTWKSGPYFVSKV